MTDREKELVRELISLEKVLAFSNLAPAYLERLDEIKEELGLND
jgi:hypothetical protein